MQLKLIRSALEPNYTIGHLMVNGKYFCDTCEDTDRGLSNDMPLEEIKKKKVYGKTAIPTGVYTIRMDIESPAYLEKAKTDNYYKQFDGLMPRLRNADDPSKEIKGWVGVLLHVGNSADDSLGCILVGNNTAKGKVTNSRKTFVDLWHILKQASDSGEKITLTIERKMTDSEYKAYLEKKNSGVRII